MCKGPFPGSSKYAKSADGSRIEMGVPFAAFMRNKTTLQPMLSLGKSVAVQFTLETSSEFGVPKQWCSDASTSFAYVFEGPSGPSAGAIAGVAVGLFLAGCLVTALAAIIWIRVCSKKAGYKQMP